MNRVGLGGLGQDLYLYDIFAANPQTFTYSGDGVTAPDYTAAWIQALVLAAATPGTTIHLPPTLIRMMQIPLATAGTYLGIPQHTTILGKGLWRSGLQYNDDTGVDFLTSSIVGAPVDTDGVVRALDIALEDFYVQGSFGPQFGNRSATTTHPVIPSQVNGLRLANFGVQGSRDLSITPRNCRNVEVLGCQVRYGARDGINLSQCSEYTIDSCWAYQVDDDGIAIHSAVGDPNIARHMPVVTNNRVFMCGGGISGLSPRHVTASNNIVDLTMTHGMNFSGGQHSGAAGEGLSAAINTVASGNVITNIINRAIVDNLSGNNPSIIIQPAQSQAGSAAAPPGQPDPSTGIFVDTFANIMANSGATSVPTPGAMNIILSDNILARTRLPVLQFSDWGYGPLWTRNGLVDIPCYGYLSGGGTIAAGATGTLSLSLPASNPLFISTTFDSTAVFQLDQMRSVAIYSTGNVSSTTFTATGWDRSGNPVTTTVTGPNNGVALFPLQMFYVATISAGSATAAAIAVGAGMIATDIGNVGLQLGGGGNTAQVISGISFNDNIVDGMSSAVQVGLAAIVDDVQIKLNTFKNINFAAIYLTSANPVRMAIESNIFDLDPMCQNPNRTTSPSINGTWLASPGGTSEGPYAYYTVSALPILTMKNNTYRNLNAVAANVSAQNGGVGMAWLDEVFEANPVVHGWNASNAGIGECPSGASAFTLHHTDCNPQSATFRQELTPIIVGANAVPTSGTFLIGKFVKALNTITAPGSQVLLGWQRITDGSANAFNTDWFAVYGYNAGGVLTVIASGTAVPAVAGLDFIKTNNSAATSITGFSGAVVGQELTVIFGDANTTVVAGSHLFITGGANFTPSVNDHMQCRFDGGSWYCMTSHN